MKIKNILSAVSLIVIVTIACACGTRVGNPLQGGEQTDSPDPIIEGGTYEPKVKLFDFSNILDLNLSLQEENENRTNKVKAKTEQLQQLLSDLDRLVSGLSEDSDLETVGTIENPSARVSKIVKSEEESLRSLIICGDSEFYKVTWSPDYTQTTVIADIEGEDPSDRNLFEITSSGSYEQHDTLMSKSRMDIFRGPGGSKVGSESEAWQYVSNGETSISGIVGDFKDTDRNDPNESVEAFYKAKVNETIKEYIGWQEDEEQGCSESFIGEESWCFGGLISEDVASYDAAQVIEAAARLSDIERLSEANLDTESLSRPVECR